ncbi:MAG: anti-sigma factor [Saprospiraceae bacterium]|nr:anti-sigma factor [Saprospiraceae bacterium]
MDIKSFIASGILEDYVMGLTSEQETQAVQCLSKIYPEILQEVQALEVTMENLALSMQVAPSAGLRNQILQSIEQEIATEQEQTPSSQSNSVITTAKTQSTEEKPTPSKINYLLLGFLVLLVIGISLITYYGISAQSTIANQQQSIAELEQKINALDLSLDTQREEQVELEEKLKLKKMQLAMVQAKGTKHIVMKGKTKKCESIIYWNALDASTCLFIRHLPPKKVSEDYQLWAIIDDKPVDLGIVSEGMFKELSMVKSVKKPDAFAITIEPKGGSAKPNLDKLCTFGKVV